MARVRVLHDWVRMLDRLEQWPIRGHLSQEDRVPLMWVMLMTEQGAGEDIVREVALPACVN